MARLRIKEVATAKGVKQSHLQMDARVTPPLLNRYWNNKTPTVDLNELQKIADALGVEPSDLITAEAIIVEEKAAPRKAAKRAKKTA